MSVATAEAQETLLARLVDDGAHPASAHRVRGVPLADRATLLRELSAPLVAAWARGSRVFSCWTHTPGDGFAVWVGGTRGFPAAPAGDEAGTRAILYPPGARADPARAAAPCLAAALDDLHCWRRVGGFVERGRGGDDAADDAILEDHAAFLAHLPFALLCVAVPVDRDAIDVRRNELTARLLESQRALNRGAADRTTAALTAEVRESVAAEAGGLWRVHLLAGARTPDDADQIAGVWGASSPNPAESIYRLAPVGGSQPMAAAAAATRDDAEALTLASPFHAGSRMLAALCRPPLVEIPGVEARATNPFDVACGDDGEIDVGEVLDRSYNPVGRLRIGLRTFGTHTFVHGATGAGKSQATRHLLTQFTRRAIPWIVLEPAKSEYAAGMTERLADIRDELPDPALADVFVIRPGDPDATPVSINPLQPEAGSHMQAHLDTLIDLATAAFDTDSPFPEVLAQAVDRCSRDAGWDPALSRPLRRVADHAGEEEPPPYAEISDLVRACHEVIDEKGYGREVAGNVHGLVDMRLGMLQTGAKRVAFATGYPLSLPATLRRNVVIELQNLGTSSDRALWMGLFLARLSQAVRVRERADPTRGRVRNVVCIEEAHRLLRNADSLSPAAARAVESFTDLLAEVRSLGVALVVAEQIPSKISADVVKNTALKCMGRTPARDDRELVGASMALSAEQSERVISFAPGEFAVHADGFDRPFLVRWPYRREDAACVARDPAPLVDGLPRWFGEAATPGALTQRDVALADELCQAPSLAVLCELVVAAHLVGLAHPTVRPELRRGLVHGLDEDAPQAVLAAIARLVGEAVRGRASVLGRYPIAALAATAVTACERAMADPVPQAPHARWLSRPAQLEWVRAALKAAPDDSPHPDTSRWIDDWGLDLLDQPTARMQLHALLRSLTTSDVDTAVALLGPRRPALVEHHALALRPALADGLEVATRFAANRAEIKPLLAAIARAADKPSGMTLTGE